MPEMTRDQQVCQDLADVLYTLATSENQALSWYKSPAYKHTELALTAAVQEVYGLSRLMAGRVRQLVAEHGPDESLRGTTGQGITSYVQYVKAWRVNY